MGKQKEVFSCALTHAKQDDDDDNDDDDDDDDARVCDLTGHTCAAAAAFHVGYYNLL